MFYMWHNVSGQGQYHSRQMSTIHINDFDIMGGFWNHIAGVSTRLVKDSESWSQGQDILNFLWESCTRLWIPRSRSQLTNVHNSCQLNNMYMLMEILKLYCRHCHQVKIMFHEQDVVVSRSTSRSLFVEGQYLWYALEDLAEMFTK